ncbi:hypothetical protein V494_00183 [Pseudogymnoascus sp. VKM F-4513 (FW-928)]|nr:hypothetical protein V494_00183 [Pseudogymnoascus sp. VKM F-4513 (FW-928)]
MSEIQKPVVDEVVAPVEAAAPAEVVAAPVEEVVAPVEVAPVEVAAATEATPEAATETPKKEFEGEGVIGYKAPGGFIKKLAGFQKRFFWFGTDAVEVKSLSNYLRGEKPEVGNHNAAWSSQTGKGLLYFSKQAGEKSAPVGLINLADITDIKEDGTVEFSFVSNSQKHVFQTANLVDRDSWVAALKEKSAEAKETSETITGSEGYKEQLASLSKPAVVAKVAEKKEEKKEEEAVAAEETKPEDKKEEAKEETKEEKKARTKSRSASRKRNSIFGGFNLGSKKEEVAADKAVTEEEPVAEAAPVEAAAVEEAAAPAETPAAEAAVVEEATATETRPAASKRHSSLFDFKSRFGSKKATTEATPVVPAKDDEVVTSTEAPVIPAVEQSEPLATSIASPATVPAETVAAEPATETAAETKAEKRKSALPFGFGQKKEKTEKAEKAAESEGEKAEKPLSPFAKLRQTVKHKTSPKAAEKPVETEAETPAATEATTETTVEANAEEPVVAAPVTTATPVVSATA